MSGPHQIAPLGPKDKFSPEMRILVASLLSMGVILLWAKFFGPKPPAILPTQAPAAQTATATPGPAYQPNSAAPPPTSPGAAPGAAANTSVAQKTDSQERTIVIENDLYRVEISNRGAVVKSWQLKKYLDDSKPQQVLDVVHPKTSQQTGGWPFSLTIDDPQMEAAANNSLYQVSSPASPANVTLSAPADVEFSWSDGRLEVTKHFYFDHTYVVRVETSVKYNGAPVTAGLAWRGGFGDLTVTNPIPVETVTTYYSENGKLSTFAHKKLDGPEKWGGTWQGGKDFAGIADRYFTAAFLPANGSAPGTLQTRYWRVFHAVQTDGKETSEAVPEVTTASRSQQPQSLRVYVGPKDYDDLKKMNPPLHSLVQFGWMQFIADPLFHMLKWLHTYIPNWGWTIVVLTLFINMLLFPLRITSYKTTLKMQRAAPEIKAIQDRYKKYKMNDPRKAEMNKEVMAVYSREGINPLGSCFQMFLQMPIWFGLNTALRYAIELRHARWLWITDLSAKDPYYVLPVVVGVTMYLVSKMTPMTSTDPQQQQMMKLMPISFAVMFVVFPFSSGLALYILTSSLVGIGQQWYLNRAHPVTPAAKPVRTTK